MSIADKLIQITENLKKIYDKGFQDGSQNGSSGSWDEGYWSGYDEGWSSGYWSGYDDAYNEINGGGEEEGVEYTCPNCGTDFRTDGPPICPDCGVNSDEWYEGMPSFTCSNCGETVYTEGPPICPHCGHEEWDGSTYTCIWCDTGIEAYPDENGMICCSMGCGRDVYVDDTSESGWEGPSGYCPNCEKWINTTNDNCHYCGTTLQWE